MDNYIHYYIRKLKGSRPLTPDEIDQTGKLFSHFRVSWDGQYFDFSYDHHIFHPIEGKSSLLVGSKLKESTVVVKPYTIQEFLNLIKDASRLTVFTPPEGLQFTPSDGVKNDYLFNVSERTSDLFPVVKFHKYTDYNTLLYDLEEKGYVSSRPSQNLIASIDKRFQITEEAVKLRLFLKDYMDHFYEADCLGTELHRELTILLEEVYQLSKEKYDLETNTNTLKS
jgi:hypothetical protein